MGAVTGLWRWRHNPLCRATDLAEAWVALAALLLLCLAVPLVGWFAGARADVSLQQSALLQQEQRHATTAQVVSTAERAPLSPRDPEASADHPLRIPVVAHWTGPDGVRHTGTVGTAPETADPGDAFRMWTDDRGRPVNPPLSPDTAREHAVLAGFGAALASAALVEGSRRVAVWGLTQRRYARLDQAWAQVGPDWGRAGADG